MEEEKKSDDSNRNEEPPSEEEEVFCEQESSAHKLWGNAKRYRGRCAFLETDNL